MRIVYRLAFTALLYALRRTVLSVEHGDAREGVPVEQSVGGAEDARGEGREGRRVVEEVLPSKTVSDKGTK